MKYIHGLSVFLLVLFAGISVFAEGDDNFTPGSSHSLRWSSSPKKDLEKNSSKQKPVLLYFYSPDKKELCRSFEKEVFMDKRVKKEARRFLCMQIASKNAGETGKLFNLAEDSAVIILADFQNKELARFETSVDPDNFADALDNAAKVNDDRADLLEKIEDAYEKSEKLWKKGYFKEAYAVWDEIESKKSEVIAPEHEKIEKEREKLKKQAEKYAPKLVTDAEKTYNKVNKSYKRNPHHAMNVLKKKIESLKKASEQFPFEEFTKQVDPVIGKLESLLTQAEQEYERQKNNAPLKK